MPKPSLDDPPTTALKQKAFFDAFGFLHLRRLFAPEAERLQQGYAEVFASNEITKEIRREDDPLQETSGREGRVSYRRIIAPDFVERSPQIAWLAEDPRVRAVVENLMGMDYDYVGSDGHLYFCDTSWHHDSYQAPIEKFHVKLSFYLDPLKAESGAIRVVPGSHFHESAFANTLRSTLRGPARSADDAYGVRADQIPCSVLESEPGDVIVWNYRTLHASLGGKDGRRSLSLSFRERAAAPSPA